MAEISNEEGASKNIAKIEIFWGLFSRIVENGSVKYRYALLCMRYFELKD